MIRTLIVDDEPSARRGIAILLEDDPDVDVVGECGDGDEALAAIRRHRPDLVLLDVQMPGKGGFEVLEALAPDELPLVVFVTAFDEHAIAAFEVEAADYLLKPFTDARFRQSVQRARARLASRDLDRIRSELRSLIETARETGEARTGAERIPVRLGNTVTFVAVDEIEWIESAGDYVRLHTRDGARLLRASMSDLEAELDPQRFQRIHRSTIVSLDRVVELRLCPNGTQQVVMESGTVREVARRRRAALERLLEGPG